MRYMLAFSVIVTLRLCAVASIDAAELSSPRKIRAAVGGADVKIVATLVNTLYR